MEILRLGLRPYQEVWELQKARQLSLINQNGQECLISCQHLPIITAGKSALDDNLLCSTEQLKQAGIEFFRVERGGDMTYHGPGQLVVYPILDLRKRKRDVSWYMRLLEESVIKTLSLYGINALRAPGKTGVWTSIKEDNQIFWGRKIASMGVKISHWCTMHGLSLNVQECEDGFSFINPCGFHEITMTSMKKESHHSFQMEEVEATLLTNVTEIFSIS